MGSLTETSQQTINWSGYKWLTQERWGQIHLEKPNWWYDPTAIQINSKSEIVLKTHYNPKRFGDIISPIGVGLISCTEKFSYGVFSIEAKLPKGPRLWPAFWMYAWESWPPEIDILEAYSNGKSSYFNWNWEALFGKVWRVETNIHLGEPPTNYSLGAKPGYLDFTSPTEKFNTYTLDWTPTYIKIYFNNKLIRHITDSKTLEQLEGKTMNVIINNGIQNSYSVNSSIDTTEFLVRNFRYTPLINQSYPTIKASLSN